MTKTIVYACANLAYDQIYSPVARTPGVEYVLFSDRRPRFVAGWDWRPLPPEIAALGPARANRYCKFFPERLFPEAGLSLYLDANLLITGDLSPFFAEFRASGAAIGLFPHTERSDIATEFAFCRQVGKIGPADQALGEAQLAAYAAEGLPPDHGLTENAIILRRHGAPGLAAAMDLWWRQLAAYTGRDQLSLPYVLWRTGLATHRWDWSYWSENPYFHRYIHRRGPVSDIQIFLTNKRLYGAAWRMPIDGLLWLVHGVAKPGLARLRGQARHPG